MSSDYPKDGFGKSTCWFSFKADGRELLNIKPENKLDGLYLNRIKNLMGKSFSDEAIKLKIQKLEIQNLQEFMVLLFFLH